MTKLILNMVCLLFLITVFPAQASVVMPGDGPYYSYRDGRTLYVFEEHSRKFIQDFAAYNRAIHEIYAKSFAWRLDEREDLVLTSPAQQVANAYATVIPNIKTVWFPSGALMLEEMAQSSWLLALTTHETAHLYQLNAKGPVNSTVKSVLGNSIVSTFFGIPMFIHPNVLAPTFLLEGNATWNESRFNLGGRLHSGEKRAVVYALLKAGEVDPNRMMNMQLKFPFGEEAYLLGGYFFAHLAKKHGPDKSNEFFVKQGDHWFNPFILNQTFRKHFGASYPQEIREFVRSFEGQAKAQKTTDAPSLAQGVFAGTFNHDKFSSWILLSNGVQPPEIVSINKMDKSIHRRPVDLPMGKVFYNEAGQPESVASLPHNLHKIEYSLYGEGLAFNEKYRGQIVTDQRAGKTVALDAANSWLEPQLLVNGTFYDVTHSSAILDDQGSVYYFRQNGFERVLYKDREPLGKFPGHYGKPVEVGANGEIYFIGNTDYGSSLYKYQNHEITRMLTSDTVVDASLINDQEFLVLEVSHKGYDLRVAKAQPQTQNPAVYDYGHPTQNLNPQKTIDAQQVAAGQNSYNSLSHLRFSSIDLQTSVSSHSGVTGASRFNFADPLEWSQFSFGAARTSDGEYYSAFYNYSRFLVDIVANYENSKREREAIVPGPRYFHRNEAQLGLGIPLLQWRRWTSSLLELAEYKSDNELGSWTERYGLLSIFNLNYTRHSGIAMFPWRALNLAYKNNLNSGLESWTKDENSSIADLNYTHGFSESFLGGEFFMRGIFSAAWAETRDIEVSFEPGLSLSCMCIDRIAGSEVFAVRNAYRARLELQKVFNLSGYSPRVPVGMRRIAPVLAAQSISLDSSYKIDTPSTIYEWGYGADLELLLFHRIPVIVRSLAGQDNLKKETQWTSTLNIQHQF